MQPRGIAIALMAAIKGYKYIITLSEKMSLEKKQILQALGARVVGKWPAYRSSLQIQFSALPDA